MNILCYFLVNLLLISTKFYYDLALRLLHFLVGEYAFIADYKRIKLCGELSPLLCPKHFLTIGAEKVVLLSVVILYPSHQFLWNHSSISYHNWHCLVFTCHYLCSHTCSHFTICVKLSNTFIIMINFSLKLRKNVNLTTSSLKEELLGNGIYYLVANR